MKKYVNLNLKRKLKILILGASSDIGIATVKLFLENNWKVTAHLNSNYKSLKKFNIFKKDFDFFKFDLRKIYNFEKYIKKNSKKFRNYDAFVNLTGYFQPSKFENFDLPELFNHLNANSISSFLLIREIIKGMKTKGWGRIVNSSSIGTKFGGGPKSFSYSLSKFNNEFFPSYFKKVYSKNIIINTLKIGLVNTKMHKKFKSKNLNQRVKLVPLKRMATKEEVANYIFYLCGRDNTLLTGKIINISGGE